MRKIIVLYFIPLYLMHLFGLIITPSSIALILIGAFTFTYWNKTIFNKQLLFLLVFLVCSIISSYINRGQGILYTTLANNFSIDSNDLSLTSSKVIENTE